MPGPEAPVLVGTDLADPSDRVLTLASGVGGGYRAGLVLAYVRPTPPDTLVPTGPHRPPLPSPLPTREAAHRALHAVAADLGGDGVEQYVVPGHPATELVALAHRTRAGLLVVGTHGRHGWERLRLGSVAEGVVRDAPCPVLVVPTRPAAVPTQVAS